MHVCYSDTNVFACFDLHGETALRKTKGNKTFVTDGQHFILDAPFGRISDVDGPDAALSKPDYSLGSPNGATIAGQSGVKVMEPVNA